MITLYVLDLDDTSDNALYQYLSDVEINIISMNPENSIDSVIEASTDSFYAGIQVTIHIPDYIRPSVMQQKINRIYEILKPKLCYGGLIT